MDADDFKQCTLQVIWDGKRMKRFICELRLTLFVNALRMADERPQCLMPFPFYFFDPKTKTKDMEQLRKHIQSIPRLDDIKDDTGFPLLTWQLLYWLFTNPVTITALHLEEPRDVFVKRLLDETKVLDIPKSDRIVYFKIDTQNEREEFVKGKETYGTFFAFHGSKFENFHSIIHRGLLSALNERSAYGHGTYLTLHYRTAFAYATQCYSIWPHSELLSSKKGIRCVGIVEVVDDPSINWPCLVMKAGSDLWTQRAKCHCCVVDRDELMQLRYVLITC